VGLPLSNIKGDPSDGETEAKSNQIGDLSESGPDCVGPGVVTRTGSWAVLACLETDGPDWFQNRKVKEVRIPKFRCWNSLQIRRTGLVPEPEGKGSLDLDFLLWLLFPVARVDRKFGVWRR
jgi:hypothetical protein